MYRAGVMVLALLYSGGNEVTTWGFHSNQTSISTQCVLPIKLTSLLMSLLSSWPIKSWIGFCLLRHSDELGPKIIGLFSLRSPTKTSMERSFLKLEVCKHSPRVHIPTSSSLQAFGFCTQSAHCTSIGKLACVTHFRIVMPKLEPQVFALSAGFVN